LGRGGKKKGTTLVLSFSVMSFPLLFFLLGWGFGRSRKGGKQEKRGRGEKGEGLGFRLLSPFHSPSLSSFRGKFQSLRKKDRIPQKRKERKKEKKEGGRGKGIIQSFWLQLSEGSFVFCRRLLSLLVLGGKKGGGGKKKERR